MSMAVWILGPDGDYVYVVAKKSTRLVATKKNLLLSGVYAGVILLIPLFQIFSISQCFFGVKQQGCPASPAETLLRMVLR